MDAPWIGKCEDDYNEYKDFEFTITMKVSIYAKSKDEAREILKDSLDYTDIDNATIIETQINY